MTTARKPQTPDTRTPERRARLIAVAERIAADARRDPKAYREETRVPAGGE